MFMKSICLSNFKGFIGDNHQINFKTPDGKAGSGLNIFIGENNSGKSSIFEAVNFLRNGITEYDTHRIKSKLSDGTRPNEACVELAFCGNIHDEILCFIPENQQTIFNNAIDHEKRLKVKRDTANYKRLYIWNNNLNKYANLIADAHFKTLF